MKKNTPDVSCKKQDSFGNGSTTISWEPATCNGSSANEYILQDLKEEGLILKQEGKLTTALAIIFIFAGFGLLYYSLFESGGGWLFSLVSLGVLFVGVKFSFADIFCTILSREVVKVYKKKPLGKNCLIQVIQKDNIEAVQILTKLYTGVEASFYNYELNIVLDDGKRLNSVVGPDLDFVEEAAQKISKLLSIPIFQN